MPEWVDPTTCLHHATELVRTIGANGKSFAWERCAACQKNMNGVGVWLPHLGRDVDTLPVANDYSDTYCAVCSAKGAELHHWAPKALFGAESDLWPTAMLCPNCHERWHQVVNRVGQLAR